MFPCHMMIQSNMLSEYLEGYTKSVLLIKGTYYQIYLIQCIYIYIHKLGSVFLNQEYVLTQVLAISANCTSVCPIFMNSVCPKLITSVCVLY